MKRLIWAAASLAAMTLAAPAMAQPQGAAANACLEPIRFDRWRAIND